MIDGNAIAEFGGGDIGVTPAISEGVGLLLLQTIEPRPIGDASDSPMTVEEFFDTQIAMTFRNQESIDVLIEQLCAVKSLMYGHKGDSNRISPHLVNLLFGKE